jgi:hypothetical protein
LPGRKSEASTEPRPPAASAGGAATIDAFTLAHIINNTDSNNDGANNIGP